MNTKNQNKKAIVLIHGLFFKSFVMKYMGQKFKSIGYNVYYFNYNTIGFKEVAVLSSFNNFLNSINESELHIIGHSMGGLVARLYAQSQYKNMFNKFIKKSIITLGTPHHGSILGKYLKSKPITRQILGTSGDSGIVKKIDDWDNSIDLGCVAGIFPIGVNSIFSKLHKNKNSSDGTVFVEEAILENSTDNLIFKTSHTGLIYNKDIVVLCDNFIKNKKFLDLKNNIKNHKKIIFK